MDVAGFFTKWLKDVAADQFPSGSVPHVIPDVLGTSRTRKPGGSAAWGDVAVIVPWNMYLVLRRHARPRSSSIPAWSDGSSSSARAPATTTSGMATTTLATGWHLRRRAPTIPGATTGKDLIATAMFAHSTDLLAQHGAGAGQERRCGEVRRAARQDQGGLRARVRDADGARGREHTDRVRAGARVRPAAGRSARRLRPSASRTKCASEDI